jgi:hypothetical protein
MIREWGIIRKICVALSAADMAQRSLAERDPRASPSAP